MTMTLTTDLQSRAAEVRRQRAYEVLKEFVLRASRNEEFDEDSRLRLADCFEELQHAFPGESPNQHFESEIARLRNYGANVALATEIKHRYQIEDVGQMEQITAGLTEKVRAAQESLTAAKRDLAAAVADRSTLSACLRMLDKIHQSYPEFVPVPSVPTRKRSR